MINSMFQFFVAVGSEWVLAILIFLSVLILAISLERFFYLRKRERAGSSLWRQYGEKWLSQGVPRDFFRSSKIPAHAVEAKVMRALSENEEQQQAERNELAIAVLKQEKEKMEERVSILGTIGNNAPYLGLLGTVIGIIRAFAALADAGDGASTALNASLAEALVATAVGIAVALQAVFFFNYFNKSIKSILNRADSLRGVIVGGRNG